MDGINPAKQIFFVGATNRPDIIDPALKRPGRLDQMIFIDLPDYPARIGILKAVMNKSPLDPKASLDEVADQTHGYSGADIAGIAKMAAKIAIRQTIEKQVQYMRFIKQKEETWDAEKEGREFDASEWEKDEEDEVPLITQQMLRIALQESKRSVTAEEYQRYLEMKDKFDREGGKVKAKLESRAADNSASTASHQRSKRASCASSSIKSQSWNMRMLGRASDLHSGQIGRLCCWKAEAQSCLPDGM